MTSLARMGSVQKGYLPTLDGWRAIAIVAVLLDHAAANLRLSHPTVFRFTRMGPNGVSLFFAISGFLICSRLLEEEDLTGRISLKGFYLRRACRILPPAFVYLIVILLLGSTGLLAVTRAEWISCAFFFRNYLPSPFSSDGWGGYTIHYWSLAVEEHFYLIWPMLLVSAGRLRARYLATGLAIVVAVWRSWDFHHHWIAQKIPGLLFASRTDVRLDGLLLGCLAALVVANVKGRSYAQRHLCGALWWLCGFAYAIVQLIARSHYYTIWESSLLALLVTGTVLNPQSFAGRTLEAPILKGIGRLSYSLYLWQQLFFLEGTRFPLSLLQRYPLNILALFAAAAASYHLIERPIIRLGHRLAPPPTAGRADLAPELPYRGTPAVTSPLEVA